MCAVYSGRDLSSDRTHEGFVLPATIPPDLADHPYWLQRPHAEMVVLAVRIRQTDSFRIVEDNHVGAFGILRTSAALPPDVGIVVVNYRWFSDWRERNYPSPLQITYRVAPYANKVVLTLSESNPDYPNSIRALVVHGNKRKGRLELVEHTLTGSERLLAVRDTETEQAVGVVPEDVAVPLLNWIRQDHRHALHVSTSWHVNRSDNTLQVDLLPYWVSDGKPKSTATAEPMGAEYEPLPARVGVPNVRWLEGLSGQNDRGLGKTPALRQKLRAAFGRLVELGVDDRRVLDVLTKYDARVVVELCDVVGTQASDVYRSRLAQGRHARKDSEADGQDGIVQIWGEGVDASAAAGEDGADEQELVEVDLNTDLLPAVGTVEQAAAFWNISVPYFKKLLQAHPEWEADDGQIYIDLMAMWATGNATDRVQMLDMHQVASVLRMSPQAVASSIEEKKLPAINLTAETHGQRGEKNHYRTSLQELYSWLGVTPGVSLLRMKEAVAMCQGEGVELVASAIEKVIEDQVPDLGGVLGRRARVYSESNVRAAMRLM